MKKIIYLLIAAFLLNFSLQAFADNEQYLKKEQIAQNVYKVKDASTREWKIVDSKNKVILDGKFDKIFVLKIDENKGDEIDNMIFAGLYNTQYPVAHIYIPKYPANNFFENLYKRHNEISNVKFYNYPANATLIIKRKNKYGYLFTQGDKYVFALPRYKRIKTPYGSTDYYKNQDTDSSSNIFKVLGITFNTPASFELKSSFIDDKFHINDFGETLPYSNYSQKNIFEDCKIEAKTITFNYSKKPIDNQYKIYKNKDKYSLKNIQGETIVPEIELVNEDILNKISDKINEKNMNDIIKMSSDKKYSAQDAAFYAALPVLVPLYVATYIPAYALSVPGIFLLPVTWPFAFIASEGYHPYLKAFFWYVN